MTFWGEVFLGIIAISTLAMALAQVSVIVGGWMLARMAARLVAQLERDIKPLTDSLNAMARDAARATSLAAAQVERVDRLVTDITSRIDDTASILQGAVLKPLREGAAVMSGLRAVLDAFRHLTTHSDEARPRSEEDDALFIG